MSELVKVFLRLGDEHGAATTYHQLGTVAQDRHDLAGAAGWYGKALEVKLRLGDEHGAANTYAQYGLLAAQRGDAACAQYFIQAIHGFDGCQDTPLAERVLAELSKALRKGVVTRGEVEQAWLAEMGGPIPEGRAAQLFPAPQPEGGTPPERPPEQ